MKKILSLLLIFAMLLSNPVTAFATKSDEDYYSIPVEYSDNIGRLEQLSVMIQNNNVFVDAKMLAERLGYTFSENSDGVIIYNKDTSNGLPFSFTQFKYNSTQVSHMLFNNMIDTYEAPFASIKNSNGSWIPLEYALLLVNSGKMLTDDVLLIDIPTKKIIDYFYDISKNSEKYNFEWANDFGYIETDINWLAGSSHLVNVFNGLLGFDGASWTTLFQQFAGSSDAYDEKYGENLAILLCTESNKELQASIEKVELLNDLLNVDGDLGKLLSFTSDMTDFQVGTLYQQCEAVLEGIKRGNSSAVDYSRSYQALENALDRQTWFSHTGENILEVQRGVSTAVGRAFDFLEVGVKVAQIVGYAQEFQNQDEFSLAALTHYLDAVDDGVGLPVEMKESMVKYSDMLSSSMGEYTMKRFTENVDQWILDAAKEQVPLHRVLGTQAAATLIAWDIASNTIPFIANGLSGADNFELALYSMIFQGDTFLNYLSRRNYVFADAENITVENMYDVSQYCYVYLKSCYITREAALASLVNKTSSTKEEIQPLIDYQNDINTEIAKILVELKGANKNKEHKVFGFLPSDNESYLTKYDDSQLVQWINSFKINESLVVDAYSEEINGRKFNIPKINLSNDAVADINAEIWTNLYDGVVVEILEWWNQQQYDVGGYINYNWYVNNGMLSLIIECLPSDWELNYYYVYNISVETGDIISNNEIISIAGLSQMEYLDTVRQALGSVYFQERESYIEQVGYDDLFRTELENTLSTDNIQNCVPYLNEEGQLCIIGARCSLGEDEFFYHEINLENFVRSPEFNEYMEIQVNSANNDTYVEQYKAILLQHPQNPKVTYGSQTIYVDNEYTLYDIDKNGIPELIVREDNTTYYIYSFNGADVVSSDVCHGYANGLYEYEGNGIVIHDGGTGRMRIEYINLYSMINDKLTWMEWLMSMEEDSYEELHSFLESLTPIDNFIPITDYSYLSN